MKFKHTVNLLIDNFKTMYKLLLYRIVITVISMFAYYGLITLFFNNLNNIQYYSDLTESISAMFNLFLEGDFPEAGKYVPEIINNFTALMDYLATTPGLLASFIIEMLVTSLITRFFQGLGNYTASELVNDKMAMQSEPHFMVTLIKNLGKSSAYNGIYVPLSLIYDCVCAVGVYFLMFKALHFLPLLAQLFLAVLLIIMLIALKLTFATDWLPAMICGKKNVGRAMTYSFARKSKGTVAVYEFYAFSCLLIMGINVMAAICTLGVGLVISIPLSYIYLLCYEFVNYYVNNDIRFFTDKRTIIHPEHEKETSREDFLRGE
ncbi:MAG: hypothetical protein LUD27_04135 [Clostridia bacterium]|nr:hypothetical protein [Clostridia bacterium]